PSAPAPSPPPVRSTGPLRLGVQRTENIKHPRITRKAIFGDHERRQTMQTTRFTRIPGMTLAVMRMLKGRNDARSHTTPRAPRTQTLHMPYERRTDMKRVGLWAAIGIGIFITVGLLTVTPGYAEEQEQEPTCTLKTL